MGSAEIMKIKTPATNPSSNIFMVFSMLLLGVFFVTLIFLYDFWSGNGNGLSFLVIQKIQQSGMSTHWVVSIATLTLLANGFFFYLVSYFLLSIPAFLYRHYINEDNHPDAALFSYVSDLTISQYLPREIAEKQSHRFRDSFIYLLLTSTKSSNASNIKFLFTQVMFARSLGAIFVFYSAYICWVNGVGVGFSISVVLSVYVVMCILYGLGLNLYETAVTGGVLVQKLHQKGSQKEIEEN